MTTYGNIPYSEALNIDDPFPKYDDAKTIYDDLFTRLNADIAALNTAGGAFEARYDLVYGSIASETDRIKALQNELSKIGADLREEDTEHWTLIPSRSIPSQASFLTYKDHRMAMAFAPLGALMDVEIERPDVVKKSYPNFWNDMKAVGFVVQPSSNVLK